MTYKITEIKTTTDAEADGKSTNSISFILMNDNDYADQIAMKLSLSGSALFEENSDSTIELTTDALGVAKATFTDNVSEAVKITIEKSDDPSINASAIVNFTETDRKVSTIFLLSQVDGAKANGTDENVVAIQAYNKNNEPVKSVEITVTLSNGAIFLDETQKTTITTSDDDGTASIQFTNVNPGTTQVTAFLPAEILISKELATNFNEVKPELSTTLAVATNNVIANGKAFDQIVATVLNKSTQKPESGITVRFTVSNGTATFIDGAKNFTNTSDADGRVYARLISTEMGSSNVVAETYTGASNSVYVDFTENYSELEIIRIFNSVKSFSEEGPTTAWPNATFYVQASGGSGDYTWTTDKESEVKFESQDDQDGIFVFTSNASPNTTYTITVKDNITNSTTSHSFTLDVFFSSFGEWGTYNYFHSNQYPTLGELTSLYDEWGDMSKYSGWLIKNGYHYWSDTNELGFAKAVNLKNGNIDNLLGIFTLCAYATKKIIK